MLHYGYAVVMLIGIWVLRKGFTGLSRKWWTAALVIQFWHHIEHALLQGQVLFHHNILGSPIPLSVLQIAFPTSRVEIHLFYNAVVFIPMMGEYVIPQILGGGKVDLMGNIVRRAFLEQQNYPLGAAIAMLLMGALSVFLIAYLWMSTRTVETGDA